MSAPANETDTPSAPLPIKHSASAPNPPRPNRRQTLLQWRPHLKRASNVTTSHGDQIVNIRQIHQEHSLPVELLHPPVMEQRHVSADDVLSYEERREGPLRSAFGSLKRKLSSRRKSQHPEAVAVYEHPSQGPLEEEDEKPGELTTSAKVKRWSSSLSFKRGSLRRQQNAPSFLSSLEGGAGETKELVASPVDDVSRTTKTQARPGIQHANSEPLSSGPNQWEVDIVKGVIKEKGKEEFKFTYVDIPQEWLEGVVMLKVSAKGEKHRRFTLNPEQGLILWESKKSGVIPIRKIQELRTGPAAKYWREHFGFAPEYEDRWLTISYLGDTRHKTLHIVAPSADKFNTFHHCVAGAMELRRAMLALLSNHPLSPEYLKDPGSTEGDPYLDIGDAKGLQNADSGMSNLVNRHLSYEQRQALWERYYWRTSDTSRNRRIEYKELEAMVYRLSLCISKEDLKRIFRENVEKGESLDFEGFQKVWRALTRRRDVSWLLRDLKVLDDNGLVTFESFERFMKCEQKDTRSAEELRNLFCSYAESPDSANPVMSLEGIVAYLLSFDNAPFEDHNSAVNQDMTRPLSEYYISSSHNTYLVGNQLIGDSTIEGYIVALLNSCRTVEIDIYDGEIEPVITHGGTFTSKIPLRDICVAIARHAFVKSPYPVIISAEVHCGLPQQDKIAEIMKECFRERLVDRRLSDDVGTLKQLPSPEMLRGRIMLKAKNLLAVEATASDSLTSFADSVSEADGTLEANAAPVSDKRSHSPEGRNSWGAKPRRGSRSQVVYPLTASPAGETTLVSLEASKELGLTEDGRVIGLPPSPSQASLRIKGVSMALNSLLVYTVGVKCRGLGRREQYAVEQMFSLSENKMDKILKEGIASYSKLDGSEHGANFGGMFDLIRHTRDHLVRTYPKGWRLRSTNYLPHRYWAAGAQLVALNWQTADLGYVLNRAMFLRNGQSGYVLKPAPLLAADDLEDSLLRKTHYSLNIKVISGQQIPRRKDLDSHNRPIGKSTMDPYVQVTIHIPDWPDATRPPILSNQFVSSPATYESASSPSPRAFRRSSLDQPAPGVPKSITKQTSSVKNNGFDPVWQEHLSLEFDVAGDMLDLVFVQFVVRDEIDGDDDHSLAMYCISLGSLRQGYRHLPLHDQQMTPHLFASLFVHIDLQKRDA